jgi:hypothetical protein
MCEPFRLFRDRSLTVAVLYARTAFRSRDRKGRKRTLGSCCLVSAPQTGVSAPRRSDTLLTDRTQRTRGSCIAGGNERRQVVTRQNLQRTARSSRFLKKRVPHPD